MAGEKPMTPAGKQRPVTVTFICNVKPDARDVYLAGDFNGWQPSAERMMGRQGRFTLKKRLPPGEYQYKFVVDGEWQADPQAPVQVPNECGSTNSVVRI